MFEIYVSFGGPPFLKWFYAYLCIAWFYCRRTGFSFVVGWK
ncbi:hypothetical protein CLOBOL_05539 [Enterocloster bolteae ATCC BAA-613]|uniref:Uncharacterized protein n=1 Tax=Enterocloster bolteae (strain ATCC BAA-613 / DSM 15670 / CCUG 46953 / JCM 12243 / WAL 16351) TaxID=411902 RepID=A8RZZ5_ENTBW|nr:hypothetical protein CLOBOL_05539 [Enterocloster bolteae ATCC BAA-613]